MNIEAAQEVSFVHVPFFIDFFITNQIIARLLGSAAISLMLVSIMLGLMYLSVKSVIRKKRILLYSLLALFLAFSVLTVGGLSNAAKTALHPASATVIADIIKEKAISGFGPFRKYYFIVKINDEYHGIVTTKENFENPRYSVGRTFDYSLYTYDTGDKMIMYRFLNPGLKLPPEPGNLR